MYAARALRETGRELRRVARAETEAHSRLRDHVTTLVIVTLGIDLVCAALAWLLEHNAQKTQVTSFGSALFWTSTQLLSVSSSYQNPITTGGQILDVFMEIWAITVIGGLAGAIGAFLVKRA